MKHELRGKIRIKFAALIPETYSYFREGNYENNKGKRNKKVCHKTKHKT